MSTVPHLRSSVILVAVAISAVLLLKPAEDLDPVESRANLPPFGDLLEQVQNDPFGTLTEQSTFIANSLRHVEEGADREEIVDILAAIASLTWTRSGSDAVRALAHIGDELEATQRMDVLLRVITSDDTRADARKLAARYLELEADESIRTRLLEFVKTRWESMIPTDAAMVLFHCGDTRYLRLLEEEFNKAGDWRNGEDAAEKSRMYRLEIQLRQMRLAKRPLPEILSAIASADNAYDRQYLVLQGARGGADAKLYGAAVVKFLGLPEELTKWAWNDPLIEDCHRLGLLTPEEAKNFPAPVHRPVSHSRPSIVPWATSYEAKWLKVHRFKKSDAVDD